MNKHPTTQINVIVTALTISLLLAYNVMSIFYVGVKQYFKKKLALFVFASPSFLILSEKKICTKSVLSRTRSKSAPFSGTLALSWGFASATTGLKKVI